MGRKEEGTDSDNDVSNWMQTDRQTYALLVEAMAARHSILSFLMYHGSCARQ